jgi:3-hydroxybutyrate dehydrogenase
MLQGRTAIATGSTSRIGLGIAEAFARAGANVVLNGFGDAMQIEKTRVELAHRTNARVVYSRRFVREQYLVDAGFDPIQFASA